MNRNLKPRRKKLNRRARCSHSGDAERSWWRTRTTVSRTSKSCDKTERTSHRPDRSRPRHRIDNELVRPRVSAHEVRDTPGRGHAVERWVPGVWIALRLSRKVPARGRLEVRLAEHGPRLARNR